MQAVLTIDVEEHFHSGHIEPVAPPSVWHNLEKRLGRTFPDTLRLLEETGAKATFFFLGWAARRWPQFVKQAAAAGHEIAAHGYSHRLVFSQTPRQFARDVRRTKLLLEDLAGKEVAGYRAADFSIRPECSWAYRVLIEAGYRYDSSLHPLGAYGYRNAPTKPHTIDTPSGSLVEFPVSVFPLRLPGREFRIPVAGGAWWRLLPQNFISHALAKAAKDGYLLCYFHPWELDAELPVFSGLSLFERYSHYCGAGTVRAKIVKILKAYPFRPLAEFLS